MSVLAFILAAAMVAPRDGPEKVSAELEQGLDLSGQWEGILKYKRFSREAKLKDGYLWLISLAACVTDGPKDPSKYDWIGIPFKITDDGKGSLRIESLFPYLGIYKCNGDQVVICYRKIENGRPTDFHADEKQNLLILHRVKSHK